MPNAFMKGSFLMDNNFNFNEDFSFNDDSFNLPATGSIPEDPVSPAGYTVPARFTKRSPAETGSLAGNYSDPYAGYRQTSYSRENQGDIYGGFGASPSSNQTPYYSPSPNYSAEPLYQEPAAPAYPAFDQQAQPQQPAAEEPEEFFVPPMPHGYEDVAIRNRYRTRNLKPLKFPVKAAITAGVLAVLFTILSFSIYNIIISARVNSVRAGTVSTVRLAKSDSEWIAREVNLEEVDGSSFSQPDTVMGKQKDVDLLLVIGSDNPNGEGYPCTTNSMVLVAIDHKRDSVKFVYLSTDLYVRIPGYFSNTLSEAYFYDTANGHDDLPVTMACITQNFGVTPDGFIVVDYLAFETIIERLGGVTLTLSDEEASYMSSHHIFGIFKRFSAGGSYSMSSSETLNYIRIKEVGDGYLDRIDRHHRVFEYMLTQAKELSQLELAGIAYDALPMCSTNLTKAQAKEIIKSAKDILDYDFFWLQAPVRGSWRYGIAQTGNGAKKVIVTSYKFTAGAIQDFIYADDMQYSAYNTVAGVVLPEVAPEPVDESAEES